MANIGALVSIVGSVFAAPAVAPVMVTGAIGVGVVTGVYGIARSITNLVDRAQHDQVCIWISFCYFRNYGTQNEQRISPSTNLKQNADLFYIV